jgi:hypothetical protein
MSTKADKFYATDVESRIESLIEMYRKLLQRCHSALAKDADQEDRDELRKALTKLIA